MSKSISDNKDINAINRINKIVKNDYTCKGISHRQSGSLFVKMNCPSHGEYITKSKFVNGANFGCKSCLEGTSGIFYINEIINNNVCIAIKFGITTNLKRRLQEQNKTTKFHINNVFSVNIGKKAKGLENYIKKSITTSTLTKKEVGSGYTETTSFMNYSKIINLKNHFIENHDEIDESNAVDNTSHRETKGLITVESSSGFIGVSLNTGRGKENKKYKCRFIYDKKSITILTNNDPKLCAIAHDIYVIDNKLVRNTNLSLGLITQLDIDNFDRNLLPNIGPVKSVRCMGSSGYLGVIRDKERFRAVININGKKIRLKSSKDPKACAEAYDKYITDNNLNRPTNKSLGLLS